MSRLPFSLVISESACFTSWLLKMQTHWSCSPHALLEMAYDVSLLVLCVCVCMYTRVCVCVCLHACVYDWTLLKLYPVESSIRKIQSSPKYAYQHAGPSHKCSTFCDLTGQDLSDVLLYASHPDHQLKGLTALAVGCLIQAILVEGRGDFSCWFRLHSAPENGMLSLTFMVDCFVLIDKNKCVTD